MRHKPFPKNDELIVHVRCPLCGGESLADLGTPVSHESTPIHYHRCRKCDLIFMNPCPTQAWYNDLYQAEFWEVKEHKENKRGQIKHQIVKEALWAEKFIAILDSIDFGKKRPAPEILEIGCAYGVIGKRISQHYKGSAWAVEPSDLAREFAEKITGVNIYARNMDQVMQADETDRFDLIIFSHVLENITEPQKAIAAVRRLLKPDGVLLIDTPNNFVRRSWHIHHPYCFTLPSLKQLLAMAEMGILVARTWSRPKYVISPIYLTIIAGKMDVPEHDKMPEWKLHLKKISGYMWFQLFNRGPVGKLNGLVARKTWAPSEAGKQEITRVLSQVDR